MRNQVGPTKDISLLLLKSSLPLVRPAYNVPCGEFNRFGEYLDHRKQAVDTVSDTSDIFSLVPDETLFRPGGVRGASIDFNSV